jgi:hypothetical protein
MNIQTLKTQKEITMLRKLGEVITISEDEGLKAKIVGAALVFSPLTRTIETIVLCQEISCSTHQLMRQFVWEGEGLIYDNSKINGDVQEACHWLKSLRPNSEITLITEDGMVKLEKGSRRRPPRNCGESRATAPLSFFVQHYLIRETVYKKYHQLGRDKVYLVPT